MLFKDTPWSQAGNSAGPEQDDRSSELFCPTRVRAASLAEDIVRLALLAAEEHIRQEAHAEQSAVEAEISTHKA